MAQQLYMQGRQRHLDQQAAAADKMARQNTFASFAQSLHIAHFEGHGDITLPDITFDITFAQEPGFTSGMALLERPDGTLWRMPIGSAYLLSWNQSTAGLYTGARVGASVFMAPVPNAQPETPARCRVQFHLVFTGVAYRGAIGEAGVDGTPQIPTL